MTTVARGDAAWLLLADLADLAYRGEEEYREVAVEQTTKFDSEPPGTMTSHEVVVRFRLRKQLLDALMRNDALTSAELMATRWATRLLQLEASELEGKKNAATTRNFDYAGACVTCRAKRSEPCRPVHAGERDAGDWAHPLRMVNADVQLLDTPYVVMWANHRWAEMDSERRGGSDVDAAEECVAQIRRMWEELVRVVGVPRALAIARGEARPPIGAGYPEWETVNDPRVRHEQMPLTSCQACVNTTLGECEPCRQQRLSREHARFGTSIGADGFGTSIGAGVSRGFYVIDRVVNLQGINDVHPGHTLIVALDGKLSVANETVRTLTPELLQHVELVFNGSNQIVSVELLAPLRPLAEVVEIVEGMPVGSTVQQMIDGCAFVWEAVRRGTMIRTWDLSCRTCRMSIVADAPSPPILSVQQHLGMVERGRVDRPASQPETR